MAKKQGRPKRDNSQFHVKWTVIIPISTRNNMVEAAKKRGILLHDGVAEACLKWAQDVLTDKQEIAKLEDVVQIDIVKEMFNRIDSMSEEIKKLQQPKENWFERLFKDNSST